MERDKVLALNHLISGSIGPLFTMGWEQGIEAQQKADWDRVKPLVEAAQGLLNLRANTPLDYAEAYYAMFKSEGAPYWKALEAALALLSVEVKP